MKKEQVDQMTLQEACDYAVLKIVEQGGRCGYYADNLGATEFDSYNCEYGNDSGKHCAVGWLLDEDNLDLMQDGHGVSELESGHSEYIPELIKENLWVFDRLQGFHDEAKKNKRTYHMEQLKGYSIDTSAPQYKQWVEMGDEG